MRRSGVLLHITSLPTPGGVGTLGKEAFEFVDWLKEAGMGIWQMLPVGPTGYGDSPYQSTCTHAGSLMMIDMRSIYERGYLSRRPEDTLSVHDRYSVEMRKKKMELLKLSFDEHFAELRPKVDEFFEEHSDLNDFVLFRAVKDYFGDRAWSQWPDTSIRYHEEGAVKHYSHILKDEIEFYKYTQFVFFRQWRTLKEYANTKGIKLLGDVPIYVAEDSSDVWANPEIFQLDEDRRPIKVAGVPPDYFSQDGQLWGNPLYNWKKLKKTGYAWWLKRLKTAGELYDMIRIDHFIGFANYYAVKAGAKTARVGKWEKAPGFSFFRTVAKELPDLDIVAEDLGVVSRRVKRLLRRTGFPGMKVMQFGFDSDENNPHFILNIAENCLLYTGTHDNDTTQGWWDSASEKTKAFALKYLPKRSSISKSMIEAALGSMASTVIIPAQDVLGLGSEARMNTPGTVGGSNWKWRLKPGELTDSIAVSLKDMNLFFGRNTEDDT